MPIEQVAEEVVNEVAANLEEAAEVTRKLNAAGLSNLAIGLGIGAVVGFYIGYKYTRKKILAEVYADAEVEIEALREYYIEKVSQATRAIAEENGDVDDDTPLQGVVPTEKPPVEEVVERLGYSAPVPPSQRPLPPPVPIFDDSPTDIPDTSKSANDGWNYERELQNRSPEAPYIIHENEFNHSNLNYTKVAYTYYSEDDYLVHPENENRPVFGGETIVGTDNLNFGHGSTDEDVVYIRNDSLELDMQITRVNRSYEEDHLGLHADVSEADDDDDSDDS